MPFSTIRLPKAPNLPNATPEYQRQFQDQFESILRMYFNQLDATIQNTLAQLTTGVDTTGYVQFNTTTPGDRAVGRLRWNVVDGTLDLGMGFDGVTNQIGQEVYFPPLYNDLGVTVEDGVLIGVTGYDAIGGGLTFTKFVADGSMNQIRALAVTTSDMADGARGFATRMGYVRDLDTTGTPYSETWAVGDTVYASPTVAGGFTNVEPIAPELSYPVGTVTIVDATEGVLLVITSDLRTPVFYGAFSDTVNQAIGAANTPQTITFNTTDASSGVGIGVVTSRVYIENNGVYDFQFSLQIESSSSASRTISIWARVNGTDVVNSAGDITIKSNTDVLVPAWNYVLPMLANDYFELVWACSDTGVTVSYHAAQTSPFVKPAVPSAILTVTQVNQ